MYNSYSLELVSLFLNKPSSSGTVLEQDISKMVEQLRKARLVRGFTPLQNIILIVLLAVNSGVTGNDILAQDGYKYQHGSFHDAHLYRWDPMELHLLSKTLGPDLNSKGFHVLNATIRQTSYLIHLSKTQGLYHPPGLPQDEENKFGCVYSGTVSELTNGQYSDIQGVASFSNCHNQNGFEGLLLFPHVQYFIRPITSDSDNTSEAGSIRSHAVNEIDLRAGPQRIVDVVLEAPRSGVLKAISEHSKDLEALQDEDPLEDDMLNSIIPDHGIPKRLLRKRRTIRRKPNVAPSFSMSKVIEIAVFADAHLYNTWHSRYPSDTITKLNQYVLAVINNMNTLYNQPSMKEGINFRLVYVEIEQHQPRNLHDHDGEQNKYLASFCGFAAERNLFGSYWDHALLLTGLDIWDVNNNLTQGLAYMGSMCVNSLSCSVIEASKFVSPFVAAHVIAHNLGVEHDASGDNWSCGDTFIMSQYTGPGKVTWSSCSMQNLRDFFAKGYGSFSAPKCLTKKGRNSGFIKISSGQKPGQQFSPKEQCEAECNRCSAHQTGVAPYDDMCYMLYCKQNTGSSTLVWPTHPALEGSRCGNGKVCRLGKCRWQRQNFE